MPLGALDGWGGGGGGERGGKGLRKSGRSECKSFKDERVGATSMVRSARDKDKMASGDKG